MAQETDLVLVHFEDKPVVFARIEAISPDIKPDWYHVQLLLLQIPPQKVTWILRNAYINGDEFTMNEKRMRLELVPSPGTDDAKASDIDESKPDEPGDAGAATGGEARSGGGKIISLSRRKKE